MIIPPSVGAVLLARTVQEAEAHLHSRLLLLSPVGPRDQAVARECLPGRPQVWEAGSDVVCTSPRMVWASWALISETHN